MNITSCESCDNVCVSTRKLSYTQWTCIKFPKVAGLNPVAPDGWAEAPYMRCTGINGGRCPLWAPRRDGQKEMGL